MLENVLSILVNIAGILLPFLTLIFIAIAVVGFNHEYDVPWLGILGLSLAIIFGISTFYLFIYSMEKDAAEAYAKYDKNDKYVVSNYIYDKDKIKGFSKGEIVSANMIDDGKYYLVIEGESPRDIVIRFNRLSAFNKSDSGETIYYQLLDNHKAKIYVSNGN